MVRLGGNRAREQRNIRRGGSILAGADNDLRPVAKPAKPHLPCNDVQPREPILSNDPQSRTENRGLGVRCHENKWTIRWLAWNDRLHRAVLQLNAMPLFPRLIHRTRISSEGKL